MSNARSKKLISLSSKSSEYTGNIINNIDNKKRNPCSSVVSTYDEVHYSIQQTTEEDISDNRIDCAGYNNENIIKDRNSSLTLNNDVDQNDL